MAPSDITDKPGFGSPHFIVKAIHMALLPEGRISVFAMEYRFTEPFTGRKASPDKVFIGFEMLGII